MASMIINSSDILWWSPLIIWELIWKGFALWQAARHSQRGWFIALLVLNTAGILPILYLWLLQPKTKKSPVVKTKINKKKNG